MQLQKEYLPHCVVGTETSSASLIYFVYTDSERDEATRRHFESQSDQQLNPAFHLRVATHSAANCYPRFHDIRAVFYNVITKTYIAILYHIVYCLACHSTFVPYRVGFVFYFSFKEQLSSHTVTLKISVAFVLYRPDIAEYCYIVVTDKQTCNCSALSRYVCAAM